MRRGGPLLNKAAQDGLLREDVDRLFEMLVRLISAQQARKGRKELSDPPPLPQYEPPLQREDLVLSRYNPVPPSYHLAPP